MAEGTNGLADDKIAAASDLGDWLDTWQGTGFTRRTADHAAEVRRLGLAYGSIPGVSKQASRLLDQAAKLLQKGQDATRRRQYTKANQFFGAAADKLRDAAGIIRSDVARVERNAGARINGVTAETFGGHDYVFPTDSSTSEATVIEWIDGDTVETSQGRVRLVGVDTPEMSAQCSQAVAAKEYAESLAPAGSAVTIGNPYSVVDTDAYGRMLRYIDLPDPGSGDQLVDVGYSLLQSELAIARYDSRDGYQWHPRESLYRAESGTDVADDGCFRAAEAAAFTTAASLVADPRSDEFRRATLIRHIADPAAAARRNLPKHVAKTRALNADQDRRKREKERDRARERARQRARAQQQREQDRQNARSNQDEDDSGSGGGYPGYTGPRCYAPGGKTWKPC